MSFEQQLRPALDTLSDRLRQDLERHVESAVQELSEHAARLSESADAERAAAVDEAARTARAEAEQAAAAQQDAALEALESRLSRDVAAVAERLEESLAAADRKLRDTMADHQAVLERTTNEHRDQMAQAAADHERRLADAIENTKQTTTATLQAVASASAQKLVDAFRAIDRAQSLSDILNALAGAVAAVAPRSVIFLTGNEQVKSWRAFGFESLELALGDAGIVSTAIELRDTAHAGGASGATPPAFSGLPDERTALAVPITVNGEVVAIVYADQGADTDVERLPWGAVVELLARHASRSLEAITAHRLARTLGSGATRPRTVAKPADVVAIPAPGGGGTTVSSVPDPFGASPFAGSAASLAALGPSSDLDREKAAAQSFAQRLMSEIRQAYESEVVAGVRDRDLMTRLGGPISRAWAQYEAKVPESIRTATNFFHTEMVRTLANGDPSLLSPRA